MRAHHLNKNYVLATIITVAVCSACSASEGIQQPASGAGTLGGTNAGNTGGTNAGNTGGTNAGNTGGTNAGNTGGTNAGNTGGTNAGNTGGTNAGNTGGKTGTGGTNAGNTGGKTGTGGINAGNTGGTSAGNTGGKTGTGGTNAGNTGGTNAGNTGGKTGTGGNAVTGGTTSTGRTTAAGGTAATGGTIATGGTATGGTATGGGTSTSPCSVSPVNPNATQQAKNLLCYLYSIYGKSVLSGQQETSWGSNPATDVNWINTQTGKYPAVLGGDFLYPGAENYNTKGTTTRALDWWKAGGILLIRYHMGAPPNSDTFDNSKGTADINAVLTSGTSANTSFNSKLDYAAKELLTLQSGNAAVLWAPFHEVQAGGWFWWAKGTGAQFKSLWKYMFDYLTTTKKVNNVLWLLPYSSNPTADYYPGDEYVDIGGADIYSRTGMPYASLYTATATVVGTTMPIALHETGTVPQPSTMFPSTAPWVLFSIWNTYENNSAENSVDSIKSAYADSHTITRDELPNLN